MPSIVGGKGPASTPTKSCNALVGCTRVLDESTYRGSWGELENGFKLSRHFPEFWFPVSSDKIKWEYIYFGIPLSCGLLRTSLGLNSTLRDFCQK